MSLSKGRAALPFAALALATLGAPASSDAQPAERAMAITSPKFAEGERIPALYTCKGSNLSPPLAFSDVPRKAKSLALIVEDPDANEPPQHGFVHWVVYDMPPSTTGLKEGAKATSDFPRGTREGINDAQRPQWSAPCPPSGTHHYVFRLYALDEKIERQGMTRVDLETSMRGHVLASAQLVGVVPHE